MAEYQQQKRAEMQTAEYYDLGVFHRSITTTNAKAQIWFDRGLVWTYAFNHEEAVDCFEKAIVEDPDCAMAYWGVAYSLGPNYNKPWEFYDDQELESTVRRSHHAAARAQALASASSPIEQALIRALQFRYPQGSSIEDCSVWNKPYAHTMERVYADFPDDLDVATLYADSLMNLNPWGLWDLKSGQPAEGARTIDAKKALDRAITQENGLQHPGVVHLYIHLMEMSSQPESALHVANHLRGLVPDAGHLHHMPTHLDILCGDYQRAIASNTDAIRADEKFLARSGSLNFYTLYRSHNYHFRIYAAMFAGQMNLARDTVDQLKAAISDDLLRVRSPPMADWLEGFLSVEIHVLVRFGCWQDILELPLPQDPELYCVTTAMTHYAKGIALAVQGHVQRAEEERERYANALGKVPASRTLFNNTCIDILKIASSMLDGEISYRRGEYDTAFTHLQQSIMLDDSLPYDEPWGWMQPARHAYGALLLEQERFEEAAAVYAADLGLDKSLPRALQHPNNVWALHGYHESLVRLGRKGEAEAIKVQLDLAISCVDVPIRSSCFCRTIA